MIARIFASLGLISVAIFFGAAAPAWGDECLIPKASGLEIGGLVVAQGATSLRGAPPQGSFGTLGASLGATKAGASYTVQDKKCVRVIFLGASYGCSLRALVGFCPEPMTRRSNISPLRTEEDIVSGDAPGFFEVHLAFTLAFQSC